MALLKAFIADIMRDNGVEYGVYMDTDAIMVSPLSERDLYFALTQKGGIIGSSYQCYRGKSNLKNTRINTGVLYINTNNINWNVLENVRLNGFKNFTKYCSSHLDVETISDYINTIQRFVTPLKQKFNASYKEIITTSHINFIHYNGPTPHKELNIKNSSVWWENYNKFIELTTDEK